MAMPLEPEILPPDYPLPASGNAASAPAPGEVSRPAGVDDETLRLVATALDELFHIPGTRIKFGLDALIGLIPGFGDLIGGMASSLIIWTAFQRGLPRVTIARMAANVAIDSILGAFPIVGDIFDAVWKANKRNVDLLQRHTQTGVSGRRKQTFLDWLFLFGALLVIAAAVVLPILVIIWLVQTLR